MADYVSCAPRRRRPKRASAHERRPARAAERLTPLDEFTLADLESVRLILRGDSVIDWRTLDFEDEDRRPRLPGAHELRADEAADRARLEHVKAEAIAYLRRQFDFPIPRPVERATVQELLLLASGKGHRALCACTILKCMHIIHHLDGRELLFLLPMSDQEVFHLVEEKVYRVIGGMLAAGFPIIEFVGGRKNKDSLYTKLLSKRDTSAAQIYDKLRFRDRHAHAGRTPPRPALPDAAALPVQLRGPRREHQHDLPFRGFDRIRMTSAEARCSRDADARRRPTTTTPRATTSSRPRVPHHPLRGRPAGAPARASSSAPRPARCPFGNVIFVLCEFQIVDRDTERTTSSATRPTPSTRSARRRR